jgi:hypothetical protein
VDEAGFNHLSGGCGCVYGRCNIRISLLEAATNVLQVFNMSATMASQGGRVQLEQSDMGLALNMTTMAKEGFLRATIEETKYLITNQPAGFRDEKQWVIECSGHKMVKAAIQRHLAMLCQNQMAGCLACPNGTSKNLPIYWRRKGTGSAPPTRCTEGPPEPTTPLPGTPPAPPGNSSGVQLSQIINLPVRYTDSHIALSCAQFFNDEQTEHDTDFEPDMLTDEG